MGCVVEKGTHLLTVAPAREFQAILQIDQLNTHSIRAGQKVRIKLAHLPEEKFVGTVVKISGIDQWGPNGNESSTEFFGDNSGQNEMNQGKQYLATVQIAGDQRLLLLGGSRVCKSLD